MSLLVLCPACGVKIKAPASTANKQLRCPNCTQPFVMPDGPPPAPTSAPSFTANGPPPVQTRPNPQYRPGPASHPAPPPPAPPPAPPPSAALPVKMDPCALPGVIAWSMTTTCARLRTARQILIHSVWLVAVFTLMTAPLGCAFYIITPVVYLAVWRFLLTRHNVMTERARWGHYLRMRDTLATYVERLTVPAGTHTNAYLLRDATIVVLNPIRFTVVDLERRDMSNPLTADVIEVTQETRPVETRTTINSTTRSSSMGVGYAIGGRNSAIGVGYGTGRSDTQTQGSETYHYDSLVTVQTRRPEVGGLLLNFGEGKESEQSATQVAGLLKAAALASRGR